MSIICLEGPSGVGKTTAANLLRINHGAFVVPEVNQLFARPEDAAADWYLERQVERWFMAREQSGFYSLSVLDGDPFQPLWYNWMYDFIGRQDLDLVEQFYRSRIKEGRIRFPDLYFVLTATEGELRRRKGGDAARQRRNFEKHLKMVEPQLRYFQAMRDLSPDRVVLLEAQTGAETAEIIMGRAHSFGRQGSDQTSGLFNETIRWLSQSTA